MHRPTIGLIAVVLLVVGMATYNQQDQTLPSAALRVGLVMAILWFAYPQLASVPRWLAIVGVVGLVVVARWPRLLVFALPVAFVLWLLRPRPRQHERG
jgi:hypothetical protein